MAYCSKEGFSLYSPITWKAGFTSTEYITFPGQPFSESWGRYWIFHVERGLWIFTISHMQCHPRLRCIYVVLGLTDVSRYANSTQIQKAVVPREFHLADPSALFYGIVTFEDARYIYFRKQKLSKLSSLKICSLKFSWKVKPYTWYPNSKLHS